MSNTRQSAIPTAGATGSPRQLSVLIAGQPPVRGAVRRRPAGGRVRGDDLPPGRRPDLHDQAGWRKPLVVVLTAAASPGESRLAREAGVHLYAEHPPDPAVLVAVLRRFQTMLADIEGFDPVI